MRVFGRGASIGILVPKFGRFGLPDGSGADATRVLNLIPAVLPKSCAPPLSYSHFSANVGLLFVPPPPLALQSRFRGIPSAEVREGEALWRRLLVGLRGAAEANDDREARGAPRTP